jgi:hypothetical protein
MSYLEIYRWLNTYMKYKEYKLGVQVPIATDIDSIIKCWEVRSGNRKCPYFLKRCAHCSSEFTVKYKNKASIKYCSRKCVDDAKRGQKNWWGYKIGDALRGIPKTQEHIMAASRARKGVPSLSLRGEKHFGWKGDKAGYSSMHDWVRLRFPCPENCQKCGRKNYKIHHVPSNGKEYDTNYLHLSNKSGQYTRSLEDWWYVCPKCHSALDRGRNSIKKRFNHKVSDTL